MNNKCSLKVACERQNLSIVHLLLETRKTFFAQLQIPISPIGQVRFRTQQLCKWVIKNIDAHVRKSSYLRSKLNLYRREFEKKQRLREQAAALARDGGDGSLDLSSSSEFDYEDVDQV
jgi:hypothetical protein